MSSAWSRIVAGWSDRRSLGIGAVPVVVALLGATLIAAGWALETVHVATGSQGVGFYNSLQIDPTLGTPAIAYSEDSSDDVLFTQWDGAQWTRQVVDAGRDVHTGISLAYNDVTLRPGVTYGWGTLTLAERGATGTWTRSVVESRKAINDFTSLVYRNGEPWVSYAVVSGRSTSLKLARRMGTSWQLQTIDTAGAGKFSSLAFDATGAPVIAYSADPDGDGTLSALRLARRLGNAWQITTLVTGSAAGVFAGLVIDPASAEMVVVHRPGTNVEAVSTYDGVTVSRVVLATTATHSSITLDPTTNSPVVAFTTQQPNSALMVVRRSSGTWAAAMTVATEAGQIFNPHLAFGPNAADPHVSYSAGSPRALKFARAAP